jgi:hypothetical protein
MTPEKQRIAIADACGWTDCSSGTGFHPKSRTKYADDLIALPDYLNDLNAMHEAEKALNTDALCDEYNSRIESMVSGKSPLGWKWHATAAQRAEAFLRTINKWDDSK